MMDLELRWLDPFDLNHGKREDLIYDIEEIEYIPKGPGVYVFSRVHGRNTVPLYVGKAENLCRRIGQQLNNVRLMRGIESAPRGYRTLHVGELIGKKGQRSEKAIAIIESALISAALVEGFDLINKKGTKTLVHAITSSGNREARAWLPDTTIKLRRA